ncbi:MAG: RtcB family protein [Thermodesulfobacteriota bacterium]
MHIRLNKLDDYRWEIPRTGDMRVPGLVFSSPLLIDSLRTDQSLRQVADVACLPGIVGRSLAMPDIHWGYGFPIGGVAAFAPDEGIVSPGGVGYDINCGCRLMTTSVDASSVSPRIRELVTALFRDVPVGVGTTGPVHLGTRDEAAVAVQGAAWAVKNGFGENRDLEFTEDKGVMAGADPDALSDRAVKRGRNQLGTLGSGNHFLELQVVDKVFNQDIAHTFGLHEGRLAVLIHSGSRGFGHQICDDFLKEMTGRVSSFGIQLPDRQLACAPLCSGLAKRYLSAMACAANYAWANRQILMHLTRETIQACLGITPTDLGMKLLYDVCHNIAKMEIHELHGRPTSLCVHRKGATRALPPGHSALPPSYQESGQPVLIPGDMGTYSYVLAGAPGAMAESFGSTCHGAGRVLSRGQAVKAAKGRSIHRELEDKGIFVQSRGKKTIKEEMPEAYKDVSLVVDAVHQAGLAHTVARLRPLGVVKG